MTEVTDTDEIYKMINGFDNEISELKSDYLAGQYEEVDDVIENTSIVYSSHLNFFDKYIEKDKPGLFTIQFPSQKSYCRKNKIKKTKSRYANVRKWWRRSKRRKRIENITPDQLLTKLPILLAQIKAGNNSYKLENEIRQILYLLYQHNKITKKVYSNFMKSLS